MPECQPTMYLSREPRRCETCPAGSGTFFAPQHPHTNPQTFVHQEAMPTVPTPSQGRACRGGSNPSSPAHLGTIFILERILGRFYIFIRAILYFSIPLKPAAIV